MVSLQTNGVIRRRDGGFVRAAVERLGAGRTAGLKAARRRSQRRLVSCSETARGAGEQGGCGVAGKHCLDVAGGEFHHGSVGRRGCRARVWECHQVRFVEQGVARSVRGSSVKTSSPAEWRYPRRGAVRRAPSSATPPRPVLTRVAVGFISASSAAPIMPLVSAVSGVCTDTTSLVRSSSSKDTQRSSSSPSLRRGWCCSRRRPNPAALRARARAIRP